MGQRPPRQPRALLRSSEPRARLSLLASHGIKMVWCERHCPRARHQLRATSAEKRRAKEWGLPAPGEHGALQGFSHPLGGTGRVGLALPARATQAGMEKVVKKTEGSFTKCCPCPLIPPAPLQRRQVGTKGDRGSHRCWGAAGFPAPPGEPGKLKREKESREE